MYINATGQKLNVSGKTQFTVPNNDSTTYRLGTAKNDKVIGKGEDILAGGDGDDSYILWQSSSQVIELAGKGIDTVTAQFAGTITLADNVENLILAGKGMVGATGNALDNLIWAGEVGATIDGGQGNDILFGGKGADVFKVAAGNGSDTVTNFTLGRDVVKLDGYGLSSFSDLMARGTQVGSDTVFTFSNQESLVLSGIKLSDLSSYDFGFAMDKAELTADQSYMEGHGRAQNHNGWYIINNSYNVGSLKPGVDFNIDATFSKADVTGGTTFTWSMPYTTEKGAPILAYPEVAFGVPPMGAYKGNPTDKAAVFPVKVGDLVSLTMDYDVDFSGNVAGFNVAYDIWLTSVPNGDRSTITNEIMLWVHKGDLEIAAPVVGTYEQGGVTYTIYHKGTYTALVADRDVPEGDIDLTAILDKLESIGIVKDSEYLASIELGAEVVSGVGSLTINNLDFQVQSMGDDGSIIVKDVTGSGQTVHEVSLLESLYSDGTAEVTSADGLHLGKVVTSVTADVVTQKFYSDKNALLSFDKILVEPNGGVTTQHYTTKGVFSGAESDHLQANGSVNTLRYDAHWKLIGAENLSIKANGDTQILRYDAQWKLLGADVISVGVDGRETTQHYSNSWTFLGSDVKVIEPSGTVSIQHYGADHKFISQDSTMIRDDGSTATYHYGADWKLTGSEVSRTGADGVVKTLVRDAKAQLLRTEFDGTDTVDVITAAAGVNIFRGGLGSDTLKAGAGADTFVFDTAITRGDVDRIVGFSSAADSIMLNNSVFTGLKSGMMSQDAFHLGTSAHDADDRIIYDQKSGSIYYDADGSGAGAAIRFAQLDPGTALTAADFEVTATGAMRTPGTPQHLESALQLVQHTQDYM